MSTETFLFRISTRRWNGIDIYHIRLTDTGWYVGHMAIHGDCTPDGEPFLPDNLNQDSVRYSRSELGVRMSRLWQRAKSENLSGEAIQAGLDEIADWITTTETSQRPTKKRR